MAEGQSESVQHTDKDSHWQKVSEAIDLLQSAATEPNKEKRLEIGKRALDISAECVEAWLMLAHEAIGDTEETKRCLGEAVAAGDRLFASRKETWRGKYWSVPQTRPYMQARVGLGQVLWELNEHTEALAVLQETLALNPSDHQGVRYTLIKGLLEEGRYVDAAAVVEQYPEEQSTPMLYAKLLTTFAVQGDSLLARSAFLGARKQNPYVLDYLLGLRTLPQKLPRQAKAGDESEAIRYVIAFGDVWESTDNILAFIHAQKKLRTDKEARKRM